MFHEEQKPLSLSLLLPIPRPTADPCKNLCFGFIPMAVITTLNNVLRHLFLSPSPLCSMHLHSLLEGERYTARTLRPPMVPNFYFVLSSLVFLLPIVCRF